MKLETDAAAAAVSCSIDDVIASLVQSLATLDLLGIRAGSADLDLAIHKLRAYRAHRMVSVH